MFLSKITPVPMSYLPGQTSIPSAIQGVVCSTRKKFLKAMTDGFLKHGSAVSVDGVHWK